MFILTLAIVLTLTPLDRHPQDANKYIGSSHYTYGDAAWADYAKVLSLSSDPQKLADFVAKNPKSELADEAICLSAAILIGQKKHEDAISLLDKVITQYPNSAYAEIHDSDRGTIIEDEMIIHQHVLQYPNFAKDVAILLKAECLRKSGKVDHAIRTLQEHVDKHPLGRWSKEDEVLRKEHLTSGLIRMERTDENIYLQLGKWYLEAKEYAKSEKVLSQGLKIFSYSHEEWRFARLLAQAQTGLGKKEAEIQTLEKLRDLIGNKRGPIRFAAERPDGTIEQLNVIPDDITLPEVEKRIKELRDEKDTTPQSTPPQQKKG